MNIEEIINKFDDLNNQLSIIRSEIDTWLSDEKLDVNFRWEIIKKYPRILSFDSKSEMFYDDFSEYLLDGFHNRLDLKDISIFELYDLIEESIDFEEDWEDFLLQTNNLYESKELYLLSIKNWLLSFGNYYFTFWD